jgi:hypothetical protein
MYEDYRNTVLAKGGKLITKVGLKEKNIFNHVHQIQNCPLSPITVVDLWKFARLTNK